MSQKTSRIDSQTVGIFWRASLAHRKLLIAGSLFPLGLLVSSVLVPLLISKTLGALVLPHGQPLHYLVAFVVVGILGLVFNRIGHPALFEHQALVLKDLQALALSTLLKRSVGFHNNNIGGKLVSDAIDYPAAYSRIADAVVSTLLPLSLTLIVGSSIIYAESWILGLCLTVTVLLIVGSGVYDSRRMAPRRYARMMAGKNVTAHVADTITNMQTVQTFSRETQEQFRHRQLSDTLTRIRIEDWHLMSRRGNSRLILLFVLQAALIYVVIHLVQQNASLLGAGIFAFTFTLTLSNRLFEVNMLLRNIEEGLLQASPMTRILLEKAEIQDVANAKDLVVAGGAVELSEVTFGYADAGNNKPVFSTLNLSIKPGEKVGLVGPSGGGKSTLTRLLLRFEDLSGGKILIDGQNIAGVTQSSLREAIAYVPQEPLLFHRTVAENIAYGSPESTLADIVAAATSANAHRFIEELPNGYDTVVGERGVKLSGGQRQRVAIARAILKNTPVLVLDEATSALDSQSEAAIQQALWQLMEGRTAIVVAHRLSTIQKMDRIVVLDGGAIIEQGNHSELLAKKGAYHSLWSRQSGGFIDADANAQGA